MSVERPQIYLPLWLLCRRISSPISSFLVFFLFSERAFRTRSPTFFICFSFEPDDGGASPAMLHKVAKQFFPKSSPGAQCPPMCRCPRSRNIYIYVQYIYSLNAHCQDKQMCSTQRGSCSHAFINFNHFSDTISAGRTFFGGLFAPSLLVVAIHETLNIFHRLIFKQFLITP